MTKFATISTIVLAALSLGGEEMMGKPTSVVSIMLVFAAVGFSLVWIFKPSRRANEPTRSYINQDVFKEGFWD